jgi:hypothetical protein
MNASLDDPGRKLGDASERGVPKSEADRVYFSATCCIGASGSAVPITTVFDTAARRISNVRRPLPIPASR